MGLTNKVDWEVLRSIDSSTFTGSYQALGSPLEHPCYICKIVNNSTVLVTVSNDGVNDKDVAPAGSFFLYDEGKVGSNGQVPAVSKGTQIYVKGSAGTGNVYLVSKYIVES